MNAPPLPFRWDGRNMVPRFPERAAHHYEVGQTYLMVEHSHRSRAEHNFYFAAIANAWENLPEEVADELPSPDHLRAWALVKAGYADKDIIKCASNDDAIVLAAVAKAGSKIRIVEVVGKVVTVWTPHSQSMRAMGKTKFQESKQKVLDVLAGMIKVEPAALASSRAA